MARTSRYHPDFDRDVIGAVEWYSERNRELAADFVSKVHDAVSRLISDPECRTPVDYGIRYWPLERFPHVVLYDFTDTEVFVLGVKILHNTSASGTKEEDNISDELWPLNQAIS